MTDYFVNNAGSGGSDAASGLSGFPWETINKVDSFAFVAGDTISFNGGEVFGDETLNLATSGNGEDGNVITIKSYGTGRASLGLVANHDIVSLNGIDFITFVKEN